MTTFNQGTESVFSHFTATPEQIRSASNDQLALWLQLNISEYKPLVMVGPSGAGKGTLINSLKENHPDMFGFSVSYTTRLPRQGEVHGKDYFFVTKDEFKEMIAQDGFIEYCEVHTNMYGTAKA